MSDIRNSIGSVAPIPMQSTGKICVLGNTLYVNEPGKGIHIFDNSNPANPINKQFLKIPGNYDLAIRGNDAVCRLLYRFDSH